VGEKRVRGYWLRDGLGPEYSQDSSKVLGVEGGQFVGVTFRHYNVYKECFNPKFVSSGCNINSKNWLGNTPLAIAASSGKCSLIRHLMSLGMFAIWLV